MAKDITKLFQEYGHKRNELISKEIDTFTSDEVNEFILKLHRHLLNFKRKWKRFKTILCCERINFNMENCRIYGVNEYEAITRLVEFNPYTFEELRRLKNKWYNTYLLSMAVNTNYF